MVIPTATDAHKYQLWVYLYQARDLYASDKSGLSGALSLPSLLFPHSSPHSSPFSSPFFFDLSPPSLPLLPISSCPPHVVFHCPNSVLFHSLPDPYAVVSFNRHSLKSRVVKESVCPMWDQTLIFEHVNLFGSPAAIQEAPPPIVLEFYDKDQVV